MKRTTYIDGYDNYSHRRNILMRFLLNEAEYQFLFDLMSVLHITNMSAFFRAQLFRAYRDLSPEQKQQMAHVAHWRASEKKSSH